VRLTAEASSTHASSRLIQGTFIVYNLHRILYELFGQCDCEQRNRKTLTAFAKVPLNCQAALMDFSELPCEPEEFCRWLKEDLHACGIVFAEPLYDGAILIAFRCEAEDFLSSFRCADPLRYG